MWYMQTLPIKLFNRWPQNKISRPKFLHGLNIGPWACPSVQVQRGSTTPPPSQEFEVDTGLAQLSYHLCDVTISLSFSLVHQKLKHLYILWWLLIWYWREELPTMLSGSPQLNIEFGLISIEFTWPKSFGLAVNSSFPKTKSGLCWGAIIPSFRGYLIYLIDHLSPIIHSISKNKTISKTKQLWRPTSAKQKVLPLPSPCNLVPRCWCCGRNVRHWHTCWSKPSPKQRSQKEAKMRFPP